jgi:TP901 family phage tail tape measure protein
MATAETEIRINVAGTPEAVRAVQGVHTALAELQRVGGVATQVAAVPVDTHALDQVEQQAASVSRALQELTVAAEQTRKGMTDIVPPSTPAKLKEVKSGIQDIVRTTEEVSGRLALHLSAPLALAGRAAIKNAVDLQQAAAGVAKTTDLTGEALDHLVADFKEMSELPGRPGADELLGIAEAAGQLGVAAPNLEGFAQTVAALRVSTNLIGEEGTADLARFGNVMQTSQRDFDRLGSAIVALGNDGASTEAEILAMGLRIAGAGKLAGLSEGDVLGYANALSSMGIEADAGGTAISRVITEISKATATGGSRLDAFAQIAGMSASRFRQAFETDAAGAVLSFIEGLRRISDEGGNAFQVLEGVEFQDIRVQNALLAAANAGDLLRKSIATGNQAWEDNAALTKESQQFYNTLGGELVSVQHTIHNVGTELGETFAPVVQDTAEGVRALLIPVRATIEVFSDFPAPVRETVGALLLITTAATPVIWYVSSVTTAFLKGAEAVRAFRAARAAAAVAEAGAAVATAEVAAGALGGLLLPGGIILTGLGLLALAFHSVKDNAHDAAVEVGQTVEEFKSSLQGMGEVSAGFALSNALDADARLATALTAKSQELAAKQKEVDRSKRRVRVGGDTRLHLEDLQADRDALQAEVDALAAQKRTSEEEVRAATRRVSELRVQPQAPTTTTSPFPATPSLARNGDTFESLYNRLDDAKSKLSDLRVDLALAGEQLQHLEPGSDAFQAMSDHVKELATNLKAATLEVRVLDSAVTRVGTAVAAPLLAKLGSIVPQVASPVVLPQASILTSAPDYSAARRAQDQDLVDTFQGLHIPLSELSDELQRDVGNALHRLGLDAVKGSNQLDQAGAIAISAFGAMAQAAVSGTEQMTAVVIGGFSQIATAAATQLGGGIWGAAVGAVGGLLGALFGRRSRQEPVPVQVDSYSSKALTQRETPEGPQTVILQIIDPTSGAMIGQQQYLLDRRERKDGVTRIPAGAIFPDGR